METVEKGWDGWVRRGRARGGVDPIVKHSVSLHVSSKVLNDWIRNFSDSFQIAVRKCFTCKFKQNIKRRKIHTYFI